MFLGCQQHLIERHAQRVAATLGEATSARVVDEDATDDLGTQCQEMGPVLAADSSSAHELEIRLISQSGGFKAFAGVMALEVSARHTAQLRIHDFHQAIERLPVAIVPSRKHSRDIALVLVRHASILSKNNFTTH